MKSSVGEQYECSGEGKRASLGLGEQKSRMDFPRKGTSSNVFCSGERLEAGEAGESCLVRLSRCSYQRE